MVGKAQLLLLISTFGVTGHTLHCKCVPSESCWPSEADWAALNTTLQGRLLRTELPAAVCYPENARYDPVACENVTASWDDPAFHSRDPVSNYMPSWANNSCNPIDENGTSTAGDALAGSRGCTLGNYPPYSVNATTAEHVQEAVRFARERNLRLNVKNTGHNPKSLAFGSLSVWTHHMKDISFADVFTPSCATSNITLTQSPEPHKAFTVGAGVQDGEIFQAAAQENLTVVGGSNVDVGVAGWTMGGGHGWLSSEFGMGADNVLQATVVTTSGDIIVANDCQNSDLFWAIRGGGGGTFGVVTGLTIKAHAMPQTTTLAISILKATNSTSAWWRLIAELHAQLPELKAGGFQGYYSITGPPSSSALSFTGTFNLYNKPNGTAESLIQPILSILDKANGTAVYSSSITWSSTWIEFFNAIDGDEAGSAGVGGVASTSRLLTAASLTEDVEYLAGVLELIGPQDGSDVSPDSDTIYNGSSLRYTQINQVGLLNPVISGCLIASNTPVKNALNRAWRDTVVHVVVAEVWLDSTPYTQTRLSIDLMTNVKGEALRSLAPETGAYYNEANDFEPNWQQSFWGTNYDLLRQIKSKNRLDLTSFAMVLEDATCGKGPPVLN
nr:RNase T2 protein [Pestalotiopsis microspora]